MISGFLSALAGINRTCLCLAAVLMLILPYAVQGQSSQPGTLDQFLNREGQPKFSNCLKRQLEVSGDDQMLSVEILTNKIEDLTTLCTSSGANVLFEATSGQNAYLICQLTKKMILDLADLDAFIAAEYVRKPSVELKQEGLDLSLNHISLLHDNKPGLSGTGLKLSIKENSFDTTDIDFHNRYLITSLTPSVKNIHAGNMASISAGGGISDPTAKGVAWDATLTSSNFDFLLPDPDNYFKDYGITVQNHSYGTAIENYYGIETMAYDESCNRLPSLVHIFSSGNDGDQSPNDGTYAGVSGWANITGQFKQSKNTISVGATDSMTNVVALSSRGPGYDGRIKPEIVAYGHGGTSGAAAIVSGLTVLIMDAFKKTHGDTFPPSSLVKAILCNTALDIRRPGPDFESGFGSVQGDEAIKSVDANHFVFEKMLKGDTKVYPFLISDEIALIKITVAWTDPAAILNAPSALVNDLDLELKNKSTGEIWHPWVLNFFPHSDSLLLFSKRGIDTLNNIEQITLAFPEPGEYEIRIGGNKIKSESQEFSLTWQVEGANTFQWIFPTGSDHLVPGRRNVLRWKAVGNDSGKIEFKTIGSDEWLLVGADIQPSSGWIIWNTPSLQGLYQVRWTNTETSFLSDTFVLGDPVLPKVGLLCPDSLLIYWDNNVTADSFEILNLGEKHMVHAGFTADTFYIKSVLNTGGFYYAIAPVFDGLSGPRSYGFDYRTQGGGCYLKNFYLKDILNGKAYFRADIGTLYNVDSVFLTKLVGDIYYPVLTIAPVNAVSLIMENVGLEQGVNLFRLEVVLNNGSRIISDTVPVYYLEKHNVLVFPNPALSFNEINILVRSTKSFSLKILDILGRELMDFEEANNPQFLTVSGLAAGHYVAVITYEDGETDTAGFIVH